MFEAYFDETGSHDSPVLSLAGFIFADGKAEILRTRWAEALSPYGLDTIHMVEFEGRRKAYAHLTEAEHEDLYRNLLELVYKTADYGLVVSLSKAAFNDAGLDESGFGTPYSLCCYICLYAVSERMRERFPELQGLLSFEAGHHDQPHAEEMMARIFSNVPEVSHRFVTKANGGPIQAADIFAWLHNRFVMNLIIGRDDMRADLEAIGRKLPLFAASMASVEEIFRLLARMGFPGPPITLTGRFGQFGFRNLLFRSDAPER